MPCEYHGERLLRTALLSQCFLNRVRYRCHFFRGFGETSNLPLTILPHSISLFNSRIRPPRAFGSARNIGTPIASRTVMPGVAIALAALASASRPVSTFRCHWLADGGAAFVVADPNRMVIVRSGTSTGLLVAIRFEDVLAVVNAFLSTTVSLMLARNGVLLPLAEAERLAPVDLATSLRLSAFIGELSLTRTNCASPNLLRCMVARRYVVLRNLESRT